MKSLMVISFLCALAWGLTGCACSRPLAPGDDGSPSVAAELASLGVWFLWGGAALVVVGVALRVYLATSPIAGLATLGAEIGATAFAFGIASIWVSDHPWLLPVTGGIALLAFGFRYRNRLRRWLRLSPDPLPKTAQTDPSTD
ncbi:hypothetical protein UFOVP141_4 [uncultured Caudovirales phage]|uniref:Uncharacterized protein n=1 Tax=uncultured Caudovirales phage TaxID=2100421 RepID=A0A6J7VJU7_9CAUD|nr:hypothetical protein UFOVP141_4 [uncultured Caudovirales phage]